MSQMAITPPTVALSGGKASADSFNASKDVHETSGRGFETFNLALEGGGGK
jgi:hypothetical protein